MRTEQENTNSNLMDRFLDLILGWFPALVGFVLIPFAMYLPSQSEFDYDLTYVIPFLLLALGALIIFAPLMLLRQQARRRTAKILFFMGLYLLLADLIAPLNLGSLTSGPELMHLPQSGFRELTQLILLGIAVVLAVKLPFEPMRKGAAAFVLALAIAEAGYVLWNLSPHSGIPWMETKSAQAPQPDVLATSGNIYQVCFDELSSRDALEAIEESGHNPVFDGFTFFKNNRSNYAFTCESMPSYFTGSFFKEGNLQTWVKKQFKGGLIRQLHDAGYAISMYVPKVSYVHQLASDGMNKLDLVRECLESPIKFQYYDFADLWLLRISPAWLWDEIYDWWGRGIFRRTIAETVSKELAEKRREQFPARAETRVPTIARALSTEDRRPARGQYIYVHTYVTHEPWGKRNGNCEHVGAWTEERPAAGISHADFVHASCAVKLMEAVIAKLKQLGRYKESTIIFQSDHGSTVKSTCDACRMPNEIHDKISYACNVDWWCKRTFALLLIKPAGESGVPLKISDSPTQLADIPATIYGILNLPLSTSDGKCVFALGQTEEREIHMFGGFQKIGFHRVFFPGKQIFEGTLFHVSFTKGKGWKLYPKMPWHWK